MGCRLAPYLGLRAGGQGAVAFAQHQHAVTRLFAIKFFYSEEAFQIERQASLLPVCHPSACLRTACLFQVLSLVNTLF